MAEERASKKLWDRGAWKDAGFFLKYLRPHYAVFVPALIALAITGSLTIVFIKELAALAGKGIGGGIGAEWIGHFRAAVGQLSTVVADPLPAVMKPEFGAGLQGVSQKLV